MLGRARFFGAIRKGLITALATVMVAVGFVPANAVAPLGNSTFLAQTQTQNLSGINGAAISPSYLAQSVTLNGKTYFVANQPGTGPELWTTDGTPGGTTLVKDVYAGGSGVTSNLTVSHGQLFMQNLSNLTVANGGSAGTYEPFVSDGTAGGTLLLKDVNPGGHSQPYGFTQGANGQTFFIANDGTRTGIVAPMTNNVENGSTLWVSDGIAGGAGTTRVKDINTYSYLEPYNGYWYSQNSNIQFLTTCNGLTFFSANDIQSNQELWVTDGTEANTRMVKDINTATTGLSYRMYSAATGVELALQSQQSVGSSPQNLTCVGNTLFFTADDGSGSQLWKSDGTNAGTVKVRGSADGSFPTSPNSLIAFNDKLIFSANASNYGPSNANYGFELWISDGTVAGTTLLKDISPSGNSSPNNMVIFNSQVFFVATDSRGAELWRTDGTTVGTLFVKDINTVSSGASSSPTHFYVWNNKLFFTANNGVNGRELFISSGTGVTTFQLKDVFPGISDILDVSNYSLNQPYFSATTSRLVFTANSPIYGQEMWISDGTELGTELLLDINTLPGFSNTHDSIAFNGKIYFSAASAYFGQELWSTDLTTGNTTQVIDIYPGASSGMDATASYFTIFQGRLYFIARSATSGWEVWSTDGTAAGTTLAFDLQPGIGQISTYEFYYPRHLTVCNNKLFVNAFNGSFQSVFAFDGSGSAPVSMYNGWLYSKFGACLNNTLYFQARDSSANDYEVWKSGGTLATTSKFFDAWNETYVSSGYTYNQSSNPSNFITVGSKLYFTATNNSASGGTGTELYSTDGTTTSVIDVLAGAGSSSPSLLTVHQGALWFRANNGSNGNDLMSYDGSTLTPRDMAAGTAGVAIDGAAGLVSAGGLLWFRGSFSPSGFELSTTDGTSANTGTFEDLSPGTANTSIANLSSVGNVIVYNTYDTVMGSQPRFVVATSTNTVSFDSNSATGGTAPADISVMAISATVPGNTGAMTKTNFNFTGWNTNAAGTGTTYLPGSTITPVVDTRLYAMWASVTAYTVTYNANGATSGVVAPAVTNVTSMITLDSNSGELAKSGGFRFDGWALNAAGTGTVYAAGARYTPTADVILYAKWTALTPYTLSFNLNGGTGTAPSNIATWATAVVTLPGQGSMIAPAGKTFAGWNTNAAGTGSAYAASETYSPQATLTFFAQWTSVPNSTLTYDANGATSGTVPSALTAAGTYVVIDSNTGSLRKTGFVFSGWNTAADGSGTTYQGTDNYLLAANVTLYAYWVAANYTVTFAGNQNTGGTVPAAITGVSVSTTLPTNTGNLVRAGYTFDGWNTLASGLGTTFATGDTYSPTSNVVLYAKWTALPTYTITYSGNGATGGGVPVAQTGVYAAVNLDNNSGLLVRSGFFFAGWNTQADGLGTTYAAGSSYTPTANITLYALWSNAPTYSLSYSSNSSTSGTAPLVQSGIVSTATVSANTGSLSRLGFRFDGWNTLADGTGSTFVAGATITLTSDTTLYALWTSVPTYTITFAGNGQTSGSIPSPITSSDSSVALPGNTGVLNKTNFTFNGWNTQADGLGTHYDVGASFALSANTTLYAEWLGNIYTLTYNSNGATSGSVPAPSSGRGAITTSTNTGSLAKTGFNFNGWNTAGDGTGTSIAAGATYTPTANTTLFARWTAIPTYTVTFNANGATSGAAPAAVSGILTTTVLPGNTGSMALASRVFGGWNTLANGSGTTFAAGSTYTATANVTLYAVWNVNYSIAYDANGATSGTAPATQTGLAGTSTVSGNTGNLAKTGFSFDGWNTLANGSGTTYAAGASISSNSDVQLFAVWSVLPTFTITYDDNGATGGSVAVSAQGISASTVLDNNSGSMTKPGFVFAGWNTQADGQGTTYAAGSTFTPTSNLTLYALWTAAAPTQIGPSFAVTKIAKRQFDLDGGVQTVFGRNLDVVTFVALDGETLKIISSSDSTLTFAITAREAGWADLVMHGDGAILTFKNFVQFVGPKALTFTNFFANGLGKITDAQISKLAIEIMRAREYKVVRVGFADTSKSTAINSRTITLRENMALVKLAMQLMKRMPKTVDVTLRLTGNTKDLTLTFNNN